ncbi:Transketolase, C-terminal section [Clostridiaceae bacterium JG1575]|nr:Transketolase, C-terminal section [Clostridiaceae bacterium JG1575]
MSKQSMRDTLKTSLEQLMRRDPNVVVLDADLASANGTLPLHELFAPRALDIGISEAHMASMSAGLSAYGLKPWAVTFTAFNSRRLADQLTISCAYAMQNVKFIATDAGVSAALNGGTHMSFEDVGILRAIPTTHVLEAADARQLAQIIEAIADLPGVFWLRMVRKEAEDIFDEDYRLRLYKGDRLLSGTDVSLIASGLMVEQAKACAALLKQEGIQVDLIALHSYKPLDEEILLETAQKTKLVVVLDNHNLHTGLYSAVAETLAPYAVAPVHGIGIEDRFGEVGSQSYLLETFGLDAASLSKKVRILCQRSKEGVR